MVHNDQIYLDAELTGAFNLKNMRHWSSVLKELEDNLRARGVKSYYAIVSDLGRYRFAKHFGFISNLVYFDKYEVVRKDLL